MSGRWLTIETRTYTDKTWRSVSDAAGHADYIEITQGILAVMIGPTVYMSEKTVGPQGQDAYSFCLGERVAA